MSDQWKRIGGMVLTAGAPILGKIVGELIPFPGGGMLAEWGINKLAEAFGVSPVEAATNPTVLANAIQNTPAEERERKLRAIEVEAAEKWDAIEKIGVAQAEQGTKVAEAIGTTQREEIAKGVSWWHWRHLGGYVIIMFSLVILGGMTKIMWAGGDVAALSALINAVTPIFLALCALNGYVAADSTALKVAAITGQAQPGVVATVVETVKKKVPR
jgi:hypothetical protein